MRHPLENPSLAPYGFVFPTSQKRLEWHDELNSTWINPERVIARLWDKLNRSNAQRPLPVRTIIHGILPGLARANLLTQGNFVFEGDPYRSSDIMLLSAAIQWLATNVGSSFLDEDISKLPQFHPEREFVMKAARRQLPIELVAVWTHVCDDAKCLFPLPHPLHRFEPTEITARDRALMDGFLRWLGSQRGREFITSYKARLKRVREVREKFVHDRRMANRKVA